MAVNLYIKGLPNPLVEYIELHATKTLQVACYQMHIRNAPAIFTIQGVRQSGTLVSITKKHEAIILLSGQQHKLKCKVRQELPTDIIQVLSKLPHKARRSDSEDYMVIKYKNQTFYV
jgi:hypothetical protein